MIAPSRRLAAVVLAAFLFASPSAAAVAGLDDVTCTVHAPEETYCDLGWHGGLGGSCFIDNSRFVGGFKFRLSSPTGFWSTRTDQDEAGNHYYVDEHEGILGLVYHVELWTFELNSTAPGGLGNITTHCQGSTV
jgi:hypothetical protein